MFLLLFKLFFDILFVSKNVQNFIHLIKIKMKIKQNNKNKKQLLTMDILVLVTMKNAAKCDT